MANKESTSPTSGSSSLFQQARTIAVEGRKVFKEGGFKGLLKRYGWKVLIVFFVYYLIRDSLLYIVLPYLVARNFF